MDNSVNILSVIEANIHRKDFAHYMDFCVKKWQKLELELQLVDNIISSICRQWHISKPELIDDKKFAEPRAIMYYIIKKQMNLSYGEIGVLFNKGKGYIHKAVDDMTFVIEKNAQKELCDKLSLIQKDIYSLIEN